MIFTIIWIVLVFGLAATITINAMREDWSEFFLVVWALVAALLFALLRPVYSFISEAIDDVESTPALESSQPASSTGPEAKTGIWQEPVNPNLYTPCEPYAPFTDIDGDGWGFCVPTKSSVRSAILVTDPWTIQGCCPYKIYTYCSFTQQTGRAISEIEFTFAVRERSERTYFRSIGFTAENLVSGKAYDCPNSDKYFWINEDEAFGYPNFSGDNFGYELDVFVKSIRMENAEPVEFELHEVKVDWDD